MVVFKRNNYPHKNHNEQYADGGPGSENRPFIFGRKNRRFKGVQKAQIGSMATEDLFNVSMDFTEAIERAGVASESGDTEEYEQLVLRAARIYSGYKHLDHLTDDIPTRKDKYKRWSQEYSRFRHESGLSDYGRVTLDIENYGYVRPEDFENYIQQVREEVEIFKNEQREYFNTVQRRRNAYQQAVEGNSSPGENAEPNTNDAKRPKPEQESDSQPESEHNSQPEQQSDSRSHYESGSQPEQQSQPDSSSEQKEKTRSHSRSEFRPEPNNNTDSQPEEKQDYQPDQKEKSQEKPYRSKNSSQARKKKRRNEMKSGTYKREPNALESVFLNTEKGLKVNNIGSFRVTSRPRVGPFTFNLGRSGLTSVSLGAGPVRWMIYSPIYQPGLSSIDLPGGLSFRGKRKMRDKNTKNYF